MTKTKTFLEMSCKRDMMIISYLNIFRFKISGYVYLLCFVCLFPVEPHVFCSTSTRNRMSSKSRSKRKPDQVGIDFCLCIVEVLIACYSCKYILKENKCKEILNPVSKNM